MRLRAGDRELLARARVEVSLSDLLATEGWRPAAGPDAHGSQVLTGPGGAEVRVGQFRDGSWGWSAVATGRGGGVIEACAQVLGWTWARILDWLRAVLGVPAVSLPAIVVAPRLPVETTLAASELGEAKAITPMTLAATPSREELTTGPAALSPLGEAGRAFLVECGLEPETVDTFAANLLQDPGGCVRAPHHPGRDDDGEELGPQGWTYVGAAASGEKRGRGLWVGTPSMQVCRVLVAPSVLAGLSAWERLPAGQRASTLVVSSTGTLTAAARHQMEAILAVLRAASESNGAEIWIYDAGGSVGDDAESQVAYLHALAARHGAGYGRCPAPERRGLVGLGAPLMTTESVLEKTAEAADTASAALKTEATARDQRASTPGRRH